MPPLHDFGSRYRRFLERLEAFRLDGFLVSHPPNLAYLFNFSGSSGLACCLDGETRLLVDSRYLEQAQAQAVNCEAVLVRKPLQEALKTVLRRRKAKRIGIESKRVSHLFAMEVQSRLPALEWVGTCDWIEELRMIKQPSEVQMLEQAFQIAHRAYRAFKDQVRPGLPELEAAALLELEIRRAGGEGVSFDTIVASGPRSSLPHGRPSRKLLRAGELVLIDFGAIYEGYRSDVTRIHWMKGAKRTRIFRIVEEAQQKALAVVRPGISAAAVDAAARDFIKNKGYGDYFGHGTGHGLGLEVHELPSISWRNRKQKLEEGMVFTIEPGIYLPGRYGIRIEDAIVVTENGCRLLSAPDF